MIAAFLSALADIFDPRLAACIPQPAARGGRAGRRWRRAGALLDRTTLFDIWYLDGAIELLGGFAILVPELAALSAVVTLVLGFFLDSAIATVEARRYPACRRRIGSRPRDLGRRPPPRLLGIALNLLALPAYLLLPGVNLLLFYAVNGWLLGREYFELVALRRSTRARFACCGGRSGCALPPAAR
jgi:hypothetical protein